jgi:hypothetical protein
MEEIVQRGLVPLENPAIKNAVDFHHRCRPADNVLIQTITKRPGLSMSFSRPVDQMLEHNMDLSNSRDELSCEFVYDNLCSVEFNETGGIWMPKMRNSVESLSFTTLERAAAHFNEHFGANSCCHCACKGNACCHCKKRKTSSFDEDE